MVADLAKRISWTANNPSVDIVAIPIARDSNASNDTLKKATEDTIPKGKVVTTTTGNSGNRHGGSSSPSATSTSSASFSEDIRYPIGYGGVIEVTVVGLRGGVSEPIVHSNTIKLVAPD